MAIPSCIFCVDIPVICPGNYCKDVVPDVLPPSVLALFAQKCDLAIKMESMYTRRLTQAKDAGWPISIDFDELLPRISALFPSLSTLLSDSTVLVRSPVWNKFLDRIGFKVFAFSRSSNRFDNGHLGCGYFGPKGQNVIESTLQALLKNDDQDKMSNDLYATLSQLLDTPKLWDQYDETSNLISPRKFSKFILVPHIAAWLIAEDLEISMNNAVEVLENSNKYGRLFNGDLPEKVDIVVAVNPESSQPPRHRKPAVNLKLPAPKLITLQNFPPPASREKKSAKKVIEKPKNSKSPKKSKQKKAEVKIPAPHGYGMIHAGLATALFPIFDGMRFEIFPVRLLVSCLPFGFSFISFFCGGFLPRLAFSSLSLGVPRVPSSSSCFAISVLVSVLVVSPGVHSGKTGTQGRKERPLVFRASCSPFRRRGRWDEGGVAGGKMLWMGISRRRVFCTLLLLLPRAVSRFLIEREREWGGGGRGVRSEVGEMACTGGASTTGGGRTGYVWVVRGAEAGVQLGAANVAPMCLVWWDGTRQVAARQQCTFRGGKELPTLLVPLLYSVWTLN
ncbi:hypothetical protein B0H11DRAFT_2291927 [Mycena galericulata]|nr:hypothetical protein B0H11DRAFT_2291927 [Mycena galericulata]